MSDSWEDYMREYIRNADIPDGFKSDALVFLASHVPKGRKLFNQRLFREAIFEYAKEFDRPISSDADADIVQTAYCFAGEAYKELGEWDNAVTHLQKAHELLMQYGIGSGPECHLAEVYIAQERWDEAIEACQEVLARVPDGYAKQLLAKAKKLKQSKRR